MTTKHLTGAYPAGYTLDPAYSGLVLKPTASVGGTGVLASATAAITNLGTVDATATKAIGIRLEAGGSVTNGSGSNTTALIEAQYWDIEADGAGSSVTNFGTVKSGYGILLADGGTMANGSAGDTAALITNVGYGVLTLGAFATIKNFGTMAASTLFAISIGRIGHSSAGASVTNGSEADTTARIQAGVAGNAIEVRYGVLTLANFGTIAGRYGALIMGAGQVTNGSETDTTALMEGDTAQGLSTFGQATIANFGTISEGSIAVWLAADGATLTNGSTSDRTALVDGGQGGLLAGGADLITNYGTIEGVKVSGLSARSTTTVDNFGTIIGPQSVYFSGGGDVLVVEKGSALVGVAEGGGGTLALTSGGTITGLGGTATLSGGESGTVSGFATYLFEAGSDFLVDGAASLAAGQAVIAAKRGAAQFTGDLANDGTLSALGGEIDVDGAVSGSGTCLINGGLMNFGQAFNQDVTFAGSKGRLRLGQSQTYSGTIAGFSVRNGTTLDLADIGFVSAGEATFAGTTSGGILTVTDGTHTARIALVGNYKKAVFVAASDGEGGTVVSAETPKAAVLPGAGAFASAMASLAGTGGAAIHHPAPTPERTHLLAAPPCRAA